MDSGWFVNYLDTCMFSFVFKVSILLFDIACFESMAIRSTVVGVGSNAFPFLSLTLTPSSLISYSH